MNRREEAVYLISGLVLAAWFSLITAPYSRGGIISIISGLEEALSRPLSFNLRAFNLKYSLVICILYAAAVLILLSDRKNYRRGSEHGSAFWADRHEINRKYSKPGSESNKILTRNVSISLDQKKHMRNLNVLVCGGSGAGKTRFYCSPNILQASSSLFLLDPNGYHKVDTKIMLFMYIRDYRLSGGIE